MKNNNLSQSKVYFKGNCITLRGRQGAKGDRLYLDYFVVENGKKIRKNEYLIKLELKSKLSKDQRKENLRTAIEIAEAKDKVLKSEEYGLMNEHSQKVDFIWYFEDYISKYKRNDKRMFISTLIQFKSFLESRRIVSIQGKDIKENLVNGFAEYLMNKETLTGETPSSYFKRFKKLLKQAKRENVIYGDPANDIRIKVNKNLSKDVLSLNELTLLKNTPCNNDQIKNAFLFSAMTGLRFVDVKQIKWKDIQEGAIKIIQEKTGNEVVINLNKTAIEMAGIPGEPASRVFNLPSFSFCMRALEAWKTKAGITKHITWHVSRHSFATNLLIQGNDTKTAAGLLGHAGLDHINRYVRLVDSLKQRATDSIEI